MPLEVAGCECVAAIWRRWGRYVTSALRRAVSRPEDVDDLTQQVFLSVVQAARSGTEIENPRAYLTTVIAGVLHQHFRRKKQRDVCVDAMTMSVPAKDEYAAPTTEMSETIEMLLSKLCDEDRLIIVAFDFLKMTRAQIGELLGMPRTTINRRYAQAIQRLRNAARVARIAP
ncbi:MAG: sigma-70 family RNA polymerase sigma factor [Phycisphaerae bacterium]|nr:sigma-70 family RNA polymerase sigma factor [Phycisphaerae bacterium]